MYVASLREPVTISFGVALIRSVPLREVDQPKRGTRSCLESQMEPGIAIIVIPKSQAECRKLECRRKMWKFRISPHAYRAYSGFMWRGPTFCEICELV